MRELVTSSRQVEQATDVKKVVFEGMVRACVSTGVTYGIDLVKTQHQASFNGRTVCQIASEIYTNKGICGFYEGVTSQLMKTTIKQCVLWVFFIESTKRLNSHIPNPIFQNVLVSWSFAVIDTLVLNPFDRLRVLWMLGQKVTFRSFIQHGWVGSRTNCLKSGLNLSVFFVTQNYLIDKHRLLNKENKELQNKELSHLQKISIAGISALTVSTVSAPIDYRFTQIQQGNSSYKLFSRSLMKSYRILPLIVTSSFFQNLFSTYLLVRIREE